MVSFETTKSVQKYRNYKKNYLKKKIFFSGKKEWRGMNRLVWEARKNRKT